MLIPLSGKPGDLKMEQIKTPADADRVMTWLCSVLKDMRTQLADRGLNPDPEWLRRMRAAYRATTNLFHRVLERRDAGSDEFSFHQVVANAFLATADEEQLAKVSDWIEQNAPNFAAVELSVLAKSPQE
jgi:predicted outer membrane protein